jgi:PAS domain S-box-containing protein
MKAKPQKFSRGRSVVVISPSRPRPKVHRAKVARNPKGGRLSLPKNAAKAGKRLFPIVGVGASAGGLEAFTLLLKHLPVNTGMGFVLVQHLDPLHESALTELLSRATSMVVKEVTDRLQVEPDCVYVIPPNTRMEIKRGTLMLQPRDEPTRGPPHSIDFFFESLAADQCAHAIGVVLSGSASDGTLGLEAIKAEGGITFAQDASAKFDSMPRNAIAAGCVDYVLPPEGIAKELTRIGKHPMIAGFPGANSGRRSEAGRKAIDGDKQASLPTPSERSRPHTLLKRPLGKTAAKGSGTASLEETSFGQILQLVRAHSGIDFSAYRPNTLQRRIARRVILSRQHTNAEYATFLEGNAKELGALSSDFLIGVTGFFRNPTAYKTLKRKVFPALVSQSKRDGPIRIWVLGCSSGQEAYSIAMSYAEYAEKLPRAPKLQIFATDLNEAQLQKARRGLYAKSLLEDLSPERLRNFFVEEDGGFRVNKSLREQVVFARQNAISDPPFSRMDLISCRNLLIYLEANVQKEIIPAFHYALRPGGYLFLGASESIGPFADLFQPVDKKQKIFLRSSAPTSSFQPSLPPVRGKEPARERRSNRVSARSRNPLETPRVESSAQREADRLSVRRFAPAGVLIDAAFHVLQFRGATSAFLELPVGKASFNVLKMAREGLIVPLRGAIHQARREGKSVRRGKVRILSPGAARVIDLEVIPLINLKERCYLVLFFDAAGTPASGQIPNSDAQKFTSGQRRPAGKKGMSRLVSELEGALAESRDYIQSIQEQFDASNDELQASSEEFQSANEELQSINEELETSKEELESTNEELMTVNEEMLHRNLELKGLNNDLNNLHVSVDTAILVVGPDLAIRRFTAPAERIFALVPGDVGRVMSSVRHSLVCDDLEAFVREVIDTATFRQCEVRDKNGHWYSLRVRPYLTTDRKIDGAVLVFVDIDALKETERGLRVSEARFHTLFNLGPVAIYSCDRTGRIMEYNRRAEELWGRRPMPSNGDERFCGSFRMYRPDGSLMPREECPMADVLTGKISGQYEGEVQIERPDGSRITVLVHIASLRDDRGSITGAINCFIDISERKRTDDILRENADRVRFMAESMPQKIFTAAANGEIDYFNRQWMEFTGLPFEQIKGWGWQQVVHPDDREETVRMWKHNIETSEDLQMEHRVRRGDGVYRWHLTRARAMRDGNGQVVMWIGSNTDIDDARRALEELARIGKAKDDFIAALSHELRTPLTPVLILAANLKDDVDLSPEIREQLGMIERNVALEARIIDDLLDLTRISHGKLLFRAEIADLHELIDSAIKVVRSEAQAKDISIERSLSAKNSRFMADSTRFQQVIWNLLRNAVKFTPKGGKITIATRNIESASGAAWLQLAVSDTGIGIASGNLEQIFVPFDQGGRSGDHRYGGLGLGLTIARAAVELHGGRIKADSGGINFGATFIVELPCLIEGSTDTPSASESLSAPAGKSESLRLLLVEDHRDTLVAITRLLRRSGHHIVTATTVGEALAAAAANSFDLVISDLGLPDGSGLKLMEDLRATYGLRGIALTGYGAAEEVARSHAAGFVKHLVKPVSGTELRRLIASICSPGN